MSDYVIEKNVPKIGNWGGGRPRKYPFGDMAIGDSFAIESNTQVSPAAAYYGKRHDKKFSVRLLDDGTYRVWRTE